MPRTSYPVAADLQAALEEAQLFDAGLAGSLELACEVAAETWEHECDWGPFLAKADETTRHFNVRASDVVRFEGGLVDVPSSVVCDGVALVEGETFWMEPEAASEWGKPYTQMRFARRIQTGARGLVVTGFWGYCRELPPDVWNAVLSRAALELRAPLERRIVVALVAAQESVVKAKESGPLRVEYAAIDGSKALSPSATFAQWETTWLGALARRRFRV